MQAREWKKTQNYSNKTRGLSLSVKRDLDVIVGNLLLQILRVLIVDRESNGDAGVEDLCDTTTELIGHGPRAHDLGNLNDVIEGSVVVMLDVLAVTIVIFRVHPSVDFANTR
jgi:hypothetical protein